MSILVAELYDALKAAGAPEDKARAAAAAVIGIDSQGGLATKADLALLRGEFLELRAEFGGLRAEFGGLQAVFGGLRAEFGELRAEFGQLKGEVKTEMAALEARLLRWVVGTIIAMTAVFGAIVKLV